jgi:hypothetical protein
MQVRFSPFALEIEPYVTNRRKYVAAQVHSQVLSKSNKLSSVQLNIVKYVLEDQWQKLG